jgi:hypothetical protein
MHLVNHEANCPQGQARMAFKVETRSNSPEADMRMGTSCSTLFTPREAAAAVGASTTDPAWERCYKADSAHRLAAWEEHGA